MRRDKLGKVINPGHAWRTYGKDPNPTHSMFCSLTNVEELPSVAQMKKDCGFKKSTLNATAARKGRQMRLDISSVVGKMGYCKEEINLALATTRHWRGNEPYVG